MQFFEIRALSRAVLGERRQPPLADGRRCGSRWRELTTPSILPGRRGRRMVETATPSCDCRRRPAGSVSGCGRRAPPRRGPRSELPDVAPPDPSRSGHFPADYEFEVLPGDAVDGRLEVEIREDPYRAGG